MLLVLGVVYALRYITSLHREKEIVEQLLHERKRQYELSKENIEVINHKCHDLKHQLKALATVEEGERQDYLEDLEYDQMTLKEYIDPFTGELVK